MSNNIIQHPDFKLTNEITNNLNPKVCQTNGELCYPTRYFSSFGTVKQNLDKFPIFNSKQVRLEVKEDLFKNPNYVRKGIFYVHNYKYSNIF